VSEFKNVVRKSRGGGEWINEVGAILDLHASTIESNEAHRYIACGDDEVIEYRSFCCGAIWSKLAHRVILLRSSSNPDAVGDRPAASGIFAASVASEFQACDDLKAAAQQPAAPIARRSRAWTRFCRAAPREHRRDGSEKISLFR